MFLGYLAVLDCARIRDMRLPIRIEGRVFSGRFVEFEEFPFSP